MTKRFMNFTIFMLAIILVLGGAVVLTTASGALDLYKAQQATRRAEAEAARIEAQLDLAQAQAAIETAKGERAVLEAAARSVDADRRLVTWYTARGDLRGLLAFIGALGLAVCGGALYVILKGGSNEKHNTEQ